MYHHIASLRWSPSVNKGQGALVSQELRISAPQPASCGGTSQSICESPSTTRLGVGTQGRTGGGPQPSHYQESRAAGQRPRRSKWAGEGRAPGWEETLTEAVEKHSQKLPICTQAGSPPWSSTPCTQLQAKSSRGSADPRPLWRPKGT